MRTFSQKCTHIIREPSPLRILLQRPRTQVNLYLRDRQQQMLWRDKALAYRLHHLRYTPLTQQVKPTDLVSCII
jgi:hypothetical protein